MTIIVSLIIFSILVVVHEWGHYIMAKRAGVFVYEFAIGMGPAIWKKQGKETLFSLRAFPMGGFVRMSPLEGEEPCLIQGEFEHKSPWQRLGVILAGPVMNILLAIVLMCSLWMITGFQVNKVGGFSDVSPAREAGLELGDTILKINETAIQSWEDVLRSVGQEGKDGKVLHLLVRTPQGQEKAIAVQPIPLEGRYIIGITAATEKNLGKSFVYGLKDTWEMSRGMLKFLGQLFTGKANTKELSGPVGIVDYVGQAMRAGWLQVVFIAALISLNLGIVNLLPFPALDGSKILLIFVEIVTRGKRLSQALEEKISIVGLAVLMGLLVLVTFQDIRRIFFS